MSQWRGQLQELSEREGSASVLGRWYHIPVLALLLAFMLWNRVRSWNNFVVDGQVYFSGNDAWYHYRTVSYTVRNWPETMPFDPYTYFPVGAHSSQFGTIFDQIVATAAIVVGLGNPDQQTIAMTLLVAPAVFGTALAIPIYFISRRLGGRFGGIIAVAIAAFSTSVALNRGMVGFSDHQIAEAVFQTIAVLGVMVAVTAAEQEKPVYELFQERAFGALRTPFGWAMLAGIGVGAYLWSWPPGVFLIGILGFYFTAELASQFAHGESPEHVAITAVVTMVVTGIAALGAFEETIVSPTSFSLLQPGLAFAGAVWFTVMAVIARRWEDMNLDRRLYPVGIVGILAVAAGLMAVALPDLFDFFVNQVLRVVGFTTSPTAGTVGEAQPLRSADLLYQRYGLAILTAVIGAAFIVIRHFTSDKPRAELTFVVFWFAFMLAATFTQGRFDYYLLAPVAVINAYIVGLVLRYANFSGNIQTVEAYQLLTVLTLVLVIVAPLAFTQPTAAAYGSSAKPGQAVQAWDSSLEWMQDNTPEEGQFGGANSDLPYYGTYDLQSDYDYPAGTYGVMSWWDYGHWITVQGERIPNANPFQQGARDAANFLLAPNETQANTVLDRLEDGDGTQTRYVMVDWKMAMTESRVGGKFFAPPKFYDDGDVAQSDYYEYFWQVQESQQGVQARRLAVFQKPAYYNTTVARLYQYHGSAVEPQPVVLDWEADRLDVDRDGQAESIAVDPQIRRFQNMTAARAFVRGDSTSQVGGVGRLPAERVPAMEHYRLVQESNESVQRPQQAQTVPLAGQDSWVKVFERVPGATIEGTGPANTEVTARVEMRIPSSNTTFTYKQVAETGPNGEFTMTVPYSTTGYDQWGPEEGYTNTSVRATGAYDFTTPASVNETGYIVRYTASEDVSEGAVIGEDTDTITVDMTKQATQLGGASNTGNETSGNATDGGTNGSSNQTNSALEAPTRELTP
ncbi:oligosaccharyl transferase, archaeosortase A system-associated [Haloarculaceae archaeon H-GB11]|nr:oligosaccharyl transferase, archaeosortase A system-associated [Haloarculaceae archaeon H-GB1-1]MEA5386491.1 oligosaccharyl transferase, archaeosortase A system-associated [Haloarculaceae archaeon H-GB11]